MRPGRGGDLGLVLLLLLSSHAVAVNWVYDEMLWTKQMWPKFMVSNPLAYINPSDQDDALAKAYPEATGSLANSVDGPHERRDPDSVPLDLDDLGDLMGLSPISDDAHVANAAEAVMCSVCHVLADHTWLNMTQRVVAGMVGHQHGMHGVMAQMERPGVMNNLMKQMCKDKVVDGVLSVAEILQLGDPGGAVMFFVVRERARKARGATAAERKAVLTACEALVSGDVGQAMAEVVLDTGDAFVDSLHALLYDAELLHRPDGEDDVRAAAREDARLDELSGGDGGDGVPAVGGHGDLSDGAAQVQQVAALVAQALAKVEADTVHVPSDDDDDDDALGLDVDPLCRDLHPMCESWADRGECEANPLYMVGDPTHKGHCKKSCGVCIPRSPSELASARGLPAPVDTSKLQARHPSLLSDVVGLAATRVKAARVAVCAASKACLVAEAGTGTGKGFSLQEHLEAQRHASSGASKGWELGTPFFGPATVEVVAEGPPPSTGHAPAAPGSLQADVDALLAKELGGKKLSVSGDFFVYEYLYKSHARHYHEVRPGVNDEDYHLGSFSREAAALHSVSTGGHAALELKDLLPNLNAVMRVKSWPYVKQVYSGGDECVLAGGRRVVRSVEARIACSPDSNINMLVREPDFCHYVFVVYSPALCSLTQFKPVDGSMTAATASKQFATNAEQQAKKKSGWRVDRPFHGPANVLRIASSSPPVVASRPEPALAALGTAVDAALAADLQHRLLSVKGDFFTFEFRFREVVRQFHAPPDPARSGATEDYSLGAYVSEALLAAGGAAPATLGEKDLLPDQRTSMRQRLWPYVEQLYSGGDECVLAGGRRVVRSVEARIACSPDSNINMLVREPDFCQYVFVIYSPALCQVQEYAPTRRGGHNEEL